LLERVAFLKGLTILQNADLSAERGMRYLERAARDYPDSVFAPLALLVVAQEYTKLKFFPEAMGLYKRIASQYPDSPYEAKILLGKGKLFKVRKMFNSAEEQFKEAFKKAKDDEDKAMATFELSIMLTHLGKTLSALKRGEEAHEKWPRLVQKYVQATLMLGENYMSVGAYEVAREIFNTLIIENPKSEIIPYLKVRIADTHLKEKKIAKAENGYSSLISESDDGMVFGKLSLADLKIEGPEKKMAVKLYRDIERSFPDHKLTEFVLFKLGMVELEKKNYTEGFNLLNDLVIRFPKGYLKGYVGRFVRKTLKEMINTFYEGKEHLNIIKTYSENKKWFGDELLLLKVAEAFVEVNLPEQAKNVLRRVRKGVNKGNKIFWSGKVAFLGNDMEHAERQFLDYVSKFPKSQYYREAQRLLGEIYYRSKKYGEAVAQYALIDLSDSSFRERDYRYMYLHAAKSFQNEGFFVKAAKYYGFAVKATPYKDGDIEAARFLAVSYSGLGSLYFSRSRYEDALQAYQKGLEVEEKSGIVDESPWFLFRIGECYEKLKKKSEAEQAFGKVKVLDNDLIGSLAEERLGGVDL
jgi:TolA-binding protein